MIYPLLKILVRLALKIFCAETRVTGADQAVVKGPVLLVSNHPNSFLDAIIIAAQFRQKIHFLARGDAFKKPIHRKMLGLLNMIPVYRLSEGKEYLHLNQEAFEKADRILEKNGIVLIFIEGICLHTHQLQPFKKGAARIALANRLNPGFSVLPIGMAYDSFDRFGKKINMVIGQPLPSATLFPFGEESKDIRYFNKRLFDEISQRIMIPEKNKGQKKKGLLFRLVAQLGYLLHLPVYRLLQKQVQQKTKGTVFYDSVLFGTLLLLYPVYLLLLGLLLLLLQVPVYSILPVLMLHPITALMAVRYYRK